MSSEAYVMVRSDAAQPRRVSNHARRRWNAILAQPPSEPSSLSEAALQLLRTACRVLGRKPRRTIRRTDENGQSCTHPASRKYLRGRAEPIP